MRVAKALTGLFLLLIAGLALFYWPYDPYLEAPAPVWSVERIGQAPLVADLAPERGYVNINGPSVIAVPDWIEEPLGAYYMYFAHHKGSYIRLAVADAPQGPWRVSDTRPLEIRDSGFPSNLADVSSGGILKELFAEFAIPVVRDYLRLLWQAVVEGPAERSRRGIQASAEKAAHIASPEIIVDHENQQIVMVYHGLNERGGQSSRFAVSRDGLSFEPNDTQVFSTYLRHFVYKDVHYLLGMPGVLYRSNSLEGPYEPRGSMLFEPSARHTGLLLDGDVLHVFWSRVGDSPESVLWSQVDLRNADWDEWRASAATLLMASELAWEGAELPAKSSFRGELSVRSHELRDPFVFRDRDESLYLYYVGGGEQAIGAARLTRRNQQ